MGNKSAESIPQDEPIMTQNANQSADGKPLLHRVLDLRLPVFWIVLSGVLLAYLLLGLPAVPFHPDEATWIYMSADWERIMMQGPSAVAWSSARENDPLQWERERAAPLARDVIAWARIIAGRSATPMDWNWSMTWSENEMAGALPDASLLWIARFPQVLVLWMTILLLTRITFRVAGSLGAFTTMVVFGLNGQVLLHARRAMSESLLLFGMVLAVLAAVELAQRKGRSGFWTLLAGFALAEAVSAKYSGLLAFPVVLVAAMFMAPGRPVRTWLRRSGITLLILALSGGICFAIFNPFYLSNPLEAAHSVVRAREEFQMEQTAAIQQAEPGWMLTSWPVRTVAMMYESFFAPPAFWDVINYAAITKTSEDAYRTSVWGGIPSLPLLQAVWCLLVLVGLAAGLVRWRNRGMDGPALILWIWFLTTVGGILWAVPILWQRYYLPLIPVLSVWAGIGMAWFVNGMQKYRGAE
jgi:hypothetical protein